MTITAGLSASLAAPLCRDSTARDYASGLHASLTDRCYARQRRSQSRWLTKSAPPVAESLSSGVWDDKYREKYGTLQYASTLLQGNRDDMQDFLDVVTKARCGFLFAGVYDGHGGEMAGDYLSKHLYKVFSDRVSEETYGQDCSIEERDPSGLCCPVELSGVLEAAFLKMDAELLKWLKDTQEGEEAVSGSTATVVLARNDKIVVANVGDSRAVLSRNGQPQDLSSEHRVLGKGKTVEEEIARVESVGGWVSDGRVCDVLAVSRAFGDPQFKGEGLPDLLEFGIEGEFWDAKFAETVSFSGDPVVATPDVTEIAVKPEDEFIILASDGLWDVMTSKEAVNFARKDLQKGRSLQAVVDKLANIAMRRYSTDNIAIVLIDLGGGREGWGKQKSGWRIFGA